VMCLSAAWQIFTNVSEEIAKSIFIAPEWQLMSSILWIDFCPLRYDTIQSRI
jgi:hypothetical protein